MRRVLLVGLVVALVASAGCLTPDDKKQWKQAVGEWNGDNIKGIAPLSKTKSSSSSSSSSSDQ